MEEQGGEEGADTMPSAAVSHHPDLLGSMLPPDPMEKMNAAEASSSAAKKKPEVVINPHLPFAFSVC